MTRLGVVAVAGALAFGSGAAEAQIKASEAASMSQTIDGTVISMEYSRPTTRGRSQLFGGVIPWGERWTPGANQATTFESNKDVQVSGTTIPAGKYSLWIDVLEEGPWRLVFEPDWDLFHLQHPAPATDQILIEFERQRGQPMDALLWYFATIRQDGGELRMHWGETVASFDVEVEPTQRITVTPEEAAVVEGTWDANWLAPNGSEGPGFELVLTYDGTTSMLAGTMQREGQSEPDQGGLILVPVADQIYAWGWGEGGELWEVTEFFFEFVRDEDTGAMTFQARNGEDRLMARGTRGEHGDGQGG